jgi:HAE1 family hydrophobic/amphiphilic exporter-1
VLIGGLITSMLLTLLVVPTAYSLLESVTRRLGNLFRRQPKPELALAGAGAVASAAPPVDYNGASGAVAGSPATNGHEEEVPTLETQERS